MRHLLLLLSLATLGAEEIDKPHEVKEVAEVKWPARVRALKPPIERLPDKDGATIWATPHFIIVCELAVTTPRLENFAQTMESVPRLFKRLPLPLWLPPKTEKAVIRLCANETSFVARGAPIEAAGCYYPRSGAILIRGDLLLNPPQARATKLQLGPNEDLLIHELTHLAMHQYGGNLPPWLTEGMAEYFAACHINKGHFDFTQSTFLIKQHIGKFYPPERFHILKLPSIKALAGITPQGWLKLNQLTRPEDRYRQYASSLLLAHYYLEGGSQRRNETSSFLNETLNRSRHIPALGRVPQERQAPLLKTPEETEKLLVAFWKSKGLQLDYSEE